MKNKKEIRTTFGETEKVDLTREEIDSIFNCGSFDWAVLWVSSYKPYAPAFTAVKKNEGQSPEDLKPLIVSAVKIFSEMFFEKDCQGLVTFDKSQGICVEDGNFDIMITGNGKKCNFNVGLRSGEGSTRIIASGTVF